MSEPVFSEGDEKGVVMFDCPGCGYPHGIWTNPAAPNDMTGAFWKWNADRVRPTVSPSLLCRGEYVCHSFITDGMIQFLGDSTHSLAGQTVPLTKWQ